MVAAAPPPPADGPGPGAPTAAERYLETVKAAVLDEHYLDNEVRLEYLATLAPGAAPDPEALRDPPRGLPLRSHRLAVARRAGRSTDGPVNLSYFPYTDMGRARLDHLHRSLDLLRDEAVPGDLVECGVGRGGGTIVLAAHRAVHADPDRTVWAFDEFRASHPAPPGTADLPARLRRFGADLHQVRDGLARFGLLDEAVRLVQGPLADTLPEGGPGQVALLRIGEAAAPHVATVLGALGPRLASGAVVVVEGTADAVVDGAVAELLGPAAPLERVDWNAVAVRLDEPWTGPSGPPAPGPRVRRRAPAAPPAPDDAIDLSVVVVLYDMRREARRTLLSLSRSYQRGIEDLDYEVLVVDNGSHPDQRLTSEEVAEYGPEMRLVELGADEVTPSPTTALNRGMAEARGAALAFMIDGAHVLTPGVLRMGMTALEAYAPAVVATQQWYLGPGQQGDAQRLGYDQDAEDALFERIRWPVDGYRLFEVGHFIGDRDWFDGLVESNCLFAPRTLLEQVGGFDDSFSMPGGGYANLDLFERLGATPGVTVASILGEGSFHQVHGGTTTNVADVERRRALVTSYGEHFEELRGRRLVGLPGPVHYVGAMATKAARRTRSRRQTGLAFGVERDAVAAARATPPQIVPDEVKDAAIEALWESQSWAGATWLGHPVARLPTDLHAYQELLTTVRPGSVLLLGDDEGLAGRALFVASVLDLLGVAGPVVAVGSAPVAGRAAHPRVVHLEGAGESADVAAEVRAVLGPDPRLTVFAGLGPAARLVAAFDRYAPDVPVGGYVVVEGTVLNGRPVVSGFGPGPHEAVVAILGRDRGFVADPEAERHTVTFNRGGFLRRVAGP